MKRARAHRIVLLSLLCVIIPAAARAQKVAVGKYQTKEAMDKTFLAAMRTVPIVKFSVRSTDKEQGTIQAIQNSSGKEFASVFIMVRKDEGNVVIEATFTRNPGFIGGGKPEQWAQKFGDELKSELPDLTITVTKR
jgi:hypothetical protein